MEIKGKTPSWVLSELLCCSTLCELSSLETALAAAGENQRVFWETASIDLPPQVCSFSPHTLHQLLIKAVSCTHLWSSLPDSSLRYVPEECCMFSYWEYTVSVLPSPAFPSNSSMTLYLLSEIHLKKCFVMACLACDSACTHSPCYLQVIPLHMTHLGLLHQTLIWSFLPACWTYTSIAGVTVYSSRSFMERGNQGKRLHYLS